MEDIIEIIVLKPQSNSIKLKYKHSTGKIN